MSGAAVGFCLSALWLIPVLLLHFRSLARIDGLLEDQAVMTRAWAEALSRPRPAPSIRRPEPSVSEKMAELRRLAERPPALEEAADPRRTIIPVDF